jgi:hypothetical protein
VWGERAVVIVNPDRKMFFRVFVTHKRPAKSKAASGCRQGELRRDPMMIPKKENYAVASASSFLIAVHFVVSGEPTWLLESSVSDSVVGVALPEPEGVAVVEAFGTASVDFGDSGS